MSKTESFSKRAASGAVMVFASQGLRVSLTMLSTIVVARILSPRDYGIAAMAAPVTSFLLMFQNIGLDQAVVQSREVDDQRLTALFWVNIMLCLGVAAALMLVSPVVGWFYHTPEAGYFVAASGLTALMTAPTLLHTALLNRELRFGALCLVDMMNSVTVFVATFVFALLLHSYWALWVGAFLGAVVSFIALWSFERWRPGLRFHFEGIGHMLRFGRNITGFNLANFFARNLDNVLIARRWGGATLGLYDRAYKLMMFPLQNINNPISNVMLPILGKLQDQPARYRQAYVMAVRGIQLLAIPGVVVAVITNERLVPFLLGERWAGVSPIFFWLGLGALIQPAGNPTGWLFISSDRTRDYMMWGIFSTITTVTAFFIGLPHGAVGVAMAYVLADMARMPLQYWWATRRSPVSQLNLWSMHGPTVAVGLVVLGLFHVLGAMLSTVVLLVVLVLAAYATMLAAYLCFGEGRALLAKGVGMIPRRRMAPVAGQ